MKQIEIADRQVWVHQMTDRQECVIEFAESHQVKANRVYLSLDDHFKDYALRTAKGLAWAIR